MKQTNNTRQEILEVAKDLFARQGVDAASMEQIARRAKVTKASLYYYFSGKEEIIKTIIEDSFSALLENLITQTKERKDVANNMELSLEAFTKESDALRIGFCEMLKKESTSSYMSGFNNTIFSLYKDELQINDSIDRKLTICISGILIAIFFILKQDISQALQIDEKKVDEIFNKFYKRKFIEIEQEQIN